MKMHLFCDPVNLRIRLLIDGIEATEDCEAIRLPVGINGNVASAYLSMIQRDGDGIPIYDACIDGPMTLILCATECDIDPLIIQASMAGKCLLVHCELLH